jgi:hypothetical protein
MLRTHDGSLILKSNEALVVTTNTQGRHGKGNAKVGMNYGAIYGKAQGPMGRCYGIITKDLTKKKHPSISKQFIIHQIGEFYEFAKKYWNVDFIVPYSGGADKINLNAYTNVEIAEMFSTFEIPDNILFEIEFSKLIKIKNKNEIA